MEKQHKQENSPQEQKNQQKKTPQCILGLQKCPRASAVD